MFPILYGEIFSSFQDITINYTVTSLFFIYVFLYVYTLQEIFHVMPLIQDQRY